MSLYQATGVMPMKFLYHPWALAVVTLMLRLFPSMVISKTFLVRNAQVNEPESTIIFVQLVS